jgi:3',5'-cyclic AMP phosphodiesterase CpdA
VPTLPLLAYGHVGRAQLDKLRREIGREPAEVTVRIVLVHHNIHHRMGMAEHVASMIDRKAFSAVMHDVGATLVLHGHTHHPHQGHLPRGEREAERWARRDAEYDQKLDTALVGALGDIPVLGCGSSTWHRDGKEYARFNVVEVGSRAVERVLAYRFSDGPGDGPGQFTEEHDDLLDKALADANAIHL